MQGVTFDLVLSSHQHSNVLVQAEYRDTCHLERGTEPFSLLSRLQVAQKCRNRSVRAVDLWLDNAKFYGVDPPTEQLRVWLYFGRR